MISLGELISPDHSYLIFKELVDFEKTNKHLRFLKVAILRL
jgi:hypothetical protein